ncbi:TPA: hypothetical protein ACS78C_000285 [Providencia alcalifaciens]
MLEPISAIISVVSGAITIWQAMRAKSSAEKAETAAETAAKTVKDLLINNRHIENITALKNSYSDAVVQSRKLGPGVTIDKIKGINIDEISERVSIFIENLSASRDSIFPKYHDYAQFNKSIMIVLSKLSAANCDNDKQKYGSELYQLLNTISNLINSKATESLNNTNNIGKQ